MSQSTLTYFPTCLFMRFHLLATIFLFCIFYNLFSQRIIYNKFEYNNTLFILYYNPGIIMTLVHFGECVGRFYRSEGYRSMVVGNEILRFCLLIWILVEFLRSADEVTIQYNVSGKAALKRDDGCESACNESIMAQFYFVMHTMYSLRSMSRP